MHIQTVNKQELIPANATDLLLDMVCAVDGQGRFAYVSAACERILGYRPDELTGRVMTDFVHPDDLESTQAVASRVMQGESVTYFENRYLHKSGNSVDILWSARWCAESGLRLAVAKDVTKLKKVQQTQAVMLAVSEAANRSIELDLLCQRILEAVAPLFHVSRIIVSLQLGGRSYRSLTSSAETGIEQLRFPLMTDGVSTGELIVEKPLDADLEPQAGELFRFIADQAASVVARRLQEERLLHMAHFDALTGLPNRRLFDDRFATALQLARRDGEQLGLLYMDLVGFKTANDTLGHQAGDELLRQIAGRLSGSLRASDTVGRPGGDEFTALLVNVSGAGQMQEIMRKLQRVVREGFLIDGHPVKVSVSIGGALYPDDGSDMSTLYGVADRAMYASRTSKLAESGPPCSR